MNSGWIAGINHGAHDAAAVLTYYGKPEIWIEQERLSRTKHAVDESPASALAKCLMEVGLRLDDLDEIALGSDHDRLAEWLGFSCEERTRALPYDNIERLLPKDVFKQSSYPTITSVPHHMAHAASAFYPSGFDVAGILVMDAMGEDTSISIYSGVDHKIKLMEEFGVQDSLGFFYEAACRFAGFTRHQAGKLMGLAAYGTPRFKMPIDPSSISNRQIWTLRTFADTPGRIGIDERENELMKYFAENCFPYEIGSGDEVMAYRDFAASAQHALQTCILRLAEHACDVAKVGNIAIAGGVGLNCTANGAISNADFVDQIFVQPASTDSGVAYGAALVASQRRYGEGFTPQPMLNAYLGSNLEAAEEIRALIDERGLNYCELNEQELVNSVADLIARGDVVAWHQGCAEIGPRALGARSILGNPTKRRMVTKINRIKKREIWRPLAPSVTIDNYNEYFCGTANPFMIVAASVRGEMQSKVPAVVHIDGSARPQAVSEAHSPLYYKLLRAVENRIGVPIVINTSLNGPSAPICYSASDSLDFLQDSELDALAIGSFLVS